MRLEKSDRGFEFLMHPVYPQHVQGDEAAIVSQSSAIGDYPDSLSRPGSSYLHVGRHMLDREEVAELARRLQAWVATGSLAAPGEGDGR